MGRERLLAPWTGDRGARGRLLLLGAGQLMKRSAAFCPSAAARKMTLIPRVGSPQARFGKTAPPFPTPPLGTSRAFVAA
jgi:hypothetical protein